MAPRTPQRGAPYRFGEFARAFDELFEDLLISRWRQSPGRPLDRALIADRGLHYEVKVPTAGADPNSVVVEVSDRRLVVRIPGPSGVVENVFDFAQPVECDGVSAKWSSGVLSIVLPKKRGRRVTVE